MKDSSTPVGDSDETGYTKSVPYLPHYVTHQNPLHMSVCATAAGFRAPDVQKKFRYLDLGCGVGTTINILAAVYPHAEFIGVDFNSDNINIAEAEADAGGLENVTFVAASFAEFVQVKEEQFDFIALHGVYSWVSDTVRAEIKFLVNKFLKPDGLAYASYYTLPGAAQFMELFDLIRGNLPPQSDDLDQDIRQSIAQSQADIESGAFIPNAPLEMQEELEELLARDSRYLVHEFGNEDLKAFKFSDVCADFKDISCEFVSSVRPKKGSTTLDPVGMRRNVEDADRRLKKLIDHDLSEQSSFRWDIFARSDTPYQNERFDAHLDAYLYDPVDYPYSFPKSFLNYHAKENRVSAQMYQDCVDALLDGRNAKTKVSTNERLAAADLSTVSFVVQSLVANNLFRPVMAVPFSPKGLSESTVFEVPSALNRHILSVQGGERDHTTLASQVLGGGLKLNKLDAWITSNLHGANLSEAVFATLLVLNSEQLAGVTLSDSMKAVLKDEKALKIAVFRFKRTVMPRLIKYGIVQKNDDGGTV